MALNIEDFSSPDIEPSSLARRREFPDVLRDLVAVGNTEILIAVDARTALNMADDIEFAVKFRGIENENSQGKN